MSKPIEENIYQRLRRERREREEAAQNAAGPTLEERLNPKDELRERLRKSGGR